MRDSGCRRHPCFSLSIAPRRDMDAGGERLRSSSSKILLQLLRLRVSCVSALRLAPRAGKATGGVLEEGLGSLSLPAPMSLLTRGGRPRAGGALNEGLRRPSPQHPCLSSRAAAGRARRRSIE